MRTTVMGENNNLKCQEILQVLYQIMNIQLLSVKKRFVKCQIKKKDEEDINKKNIEPNILDYDINFCISIDDITNALSEDEIFIKFAEKF